MCCLLLEVLQKDVQFVTVHEPAPYLENIFASSCGYSAVADVLAAAVKNLSSVNVQTQEQR